MADVVRLAGLRAACHALFKQIFGEVGRSKSKGDRARQHDASPCDAESHHHDVLSNTQLFQSHRSRQELKSQREQAAISLAGGKPAFTAAISTACDTKFDKRYPASRITAAVTRCGTYASRDWAN